MTPPRHSERTGRFLVVWLLLWFAVMTVHPVVAATAQPACSTQPAGGSHAHHHEASAAQDGLVCDSTGDDEAAGHDHASASLLHCPVCANAAAPLAIHVDALPAQLPATELAFHRPCAHLQVPACKPPPARGPPRS